MRENFFRDLISDAVVDVALKLGEHAEKRERERERERERDSFIESMGD